MHLEVADPVVLGHGRLEFVGELRHNLTRLFLGDLGLEDVGVDSKNGSLEQFFLLLFHDPVVLDVWIHAGGKVIGIGFHNL